MPRTNDGGRAPLRTLKLGELAVEFRRGRSLWKEKYVGPDPYAGESVEFWVPLSFGWRILRGDGRELSREWFRVLLGRAYVHIRLRPFIVVWSYYNRRVYAHLRWN